MYLTFNWMDMNFKFKSGKRIFKSPTVENSPPQQN